MADTLEFTLNNPLTEEQWDMITDVDFDHTERIWFHTKHGKEVEFAKVIRCKDCKWFSIIGYCDLLRFRIVDSYKYCAWAERKEA